MKRRFINTKVVIDIATDRVIEREGFEYEGPLAEAVAATAISKLGEIHGNGMRIEWWIFTIDPGSIAAGAQEIDTVAVPGARAGDPCWLNTRSPVVNLNNQGAKVTANDVVSIYLENNITVTTALDATAVICDLLIFKRAV